MKKGLSLFGLGFLAGFLVFGLGAMRDARAYQVLSSKELGQNDAKNQNVVVKCTTDTGKVSNQTCSLRRYAKCTGTGANKKCNQYSDWKSAASACCRAKGLR